MAEALHYYPPGPVAAAFLRSRAFLSGIRGPVGSGKSTACILKLLRHAQLQPKQRDGKRRCRYGVVRNTYDELRRTTIKSWHQWVPETVGEWRGGEQGPFRHRLNGVIADDLDLEVEFVALDGADAIGKVLSWEVTGVWVNEAREVQKAILDALTGRVGRFPAHSEGGCVDPGVWMDTNSPDTDHWWYVLAERDGSLARNRRMLEDMDRIEGELRDKGLLQPDQALVEFFSQPSGKSPQAENTGNLRPGYYDFSSVGKREEWVKVYIDGEYGFVADGKPVYPEYRDALHCRPFELNMQGSLHIGMDFGLTPAAVFAQRTASGQWRWHTELVTEQLGIKRFSRLLREHIGEHYRNMTIATMTGDPSGTSRAETDESTVFQVLKAEGFDVVPAHSNVFSIRREAIANALGRLIDGEPGLIVHPQCVVLRKALLGGYCFRRMQVRGDERFRDEPDKGSYSHVAEAGQYQMLGSGGWQEVMGSESRIPRIQTRRRSNTTWMAS